MNNIQEKYDFFKECPFLFEIDSSYKYYHTAGFIVFGFESTVDFIKIEDVRIKENDCIVGILLSIDTESGKVAIYDGWSGNSFQLEEALKLAEPKNYKKIISSSNILWNLDYFT